MLQTVGTKYQIVIPKKTRARVTSIRPGAKVNIYALDDDTVALRVVKKDWVEQNYGMMARVWKNINPTSELEKMRNEWDEKN